ncbi:glyoxylate/hydroxypyruvate reductase A [Aliidongia dinghuensis]|uniref:Glyoxylate/hydroxypyruvate reductase A n=1 Tax=Aliidongia dinghuensis TaxID=1867774 RepID=A0A8J2Z0L0_9PROT|nr:glyoxylate/hydroxypyruvate reductase A [Aliidongia dinghuensis]GGF45431.1 glyoxylate/hydroxypyruvate reductase A [Aliidongia dinghuensis]
MAILCLLHQAYGKKLIGAIREGLPDEDIREWPEAGNPDDIEICMIFRMSPGFLAPYKNLKLISATGAGVDHYLLDPEFPRHLPLVRVVDESFAARMADYVLSWVMFHHRDIAHYLDAQKRREWAFKVMRPASEVTIGVMGLGQMGALTAKRLASLGYDVRGWARTPHEIDGVECFAGEAGFGSFLTKTEILINLLPLTPETRGILSSGTFDRMPKGGVLISAGRGGHMVEADIIAALNDGQLRAATIDAFQKEPVPQDHPFWDTSGLYVTPHCSSTASLETIVDSFAGNVRRFRAGEPLLNIVDYAQGY